MRCIDRTRRTRRARRAAATALLVLVARIASAQTRPPEPPPDGIGTAAAAAAGIVAPADLQAQPAGAHTPPRYPKLPPPERPPSFDALRLQFAQRLVAAHPDTSFTAPAPDRLLAIPVLEIDLNADGSVRRIHVLRHPTTGAAATRLAIAAVHRAAPYGNVSRLPRPWRLTETFLFNDALQFKPRLLDLD